MKWCTPCNGCLDGTLCWVGQVRLLMSEGAAGRTSVKTSGFRFKPVRGVQTWSCSARLLCRSSHAAPVVDFYADALICPETC